MNNFYISKTYESGQNAFKGLNLINSFLFGASTEKPENAEFIAKLIIERATGKKVGKISVMPEKSLLGIYLGNHGIRMDLYIEEYENEQMARVYDIEPNIINCRNIFLFGFCHMIRSDKTECCIR